MNQQPIEKLDYQADGSLEVHSLFYTIQGEGPFTGEPAIFIRLAGCNLQCPGCDTEYTNQRERKSAYELRDKINELKEAEFPDAPRPLIVITGGEPFRQNITKFANLMIGTDWRVQVETNGTLPPGEDLSPLVWIVVSPKTGKMNNRIEERIHALKYVVKANCIDRADGLPIRALDHTCTPTVAKPPYWYKGPIYLQPFDDGTIRGRTENGSAAVNACKRHGHLLQVQTHKVLGLE